MWPTYSFDSMGRLQSVRQLISANHKQIQPKYLWAANEEMVKLKPGDDLSRLDSTDFAMTSCQNNDNLKPKTLLGSILMEKAKWDQNPNDSNC